jgi:hypothetical protein
LRLLGLILAWVVCGSAVAQTASQQQYDAAFQDMLKRPADLDVMFKYATVAAEHGNLEGAISALEGMLLINPDLPRVRLELGVLYYRLGSYAAARTYLESALNSRALPPEVRARAEQFLAQTRKVDSPSKLSGEVFAGLRYQSNANLGPPTSSVRLFGQTANLNQAAVGTSDWGLVSSLQLRHLYDLGTQDNARIETFFTAYANRQFELSAANVSLLDLTSGPRFQVFQGMFEEVSLKPFVALGYIWVNDTPFYGSYGAGVESTVLLGSHLRNTSVFIFRQQDYPDSNYLPTNSQFTGTQYSANTVFEYQVLQAVTVFAVANGQRYQTKQAPWQSYALYGVGGGVTIRFLDPVLKSGLAWTVTVQATRQWWLYDAVDPVIDPTTIRSQTDTILNLTLSVPVDERTTLSLSGGRLNRVASVPNYEFANNSLMVGASWRF